MYRPPAFREDRLEVLHAFIRAHPLGMLVSAGAGGLMANPIPFLVDEAATEKGLLRAHLAKANDQLAALRQGAEVMVLFQGPDAYVTPSWYASKREHGKVVPTWNYATVHAWGTPRVIDDETWLRGQIGDLTLSREASREHPWGVEDAPADFLAGQIKGIVGLEIPIARIEGKWKVSQNRSAADRQGVVDGLRQEAPEKGDMADLVEQCGDISRD
ncbi:transcriptional regulator [Kaistia hirudinis]|uniref:Transcriptional regulator n=1 Tax=Kaistia hirudinis TaxID=1293440 RepID=A0A840AN58_9HYPH|nr:FMN-binding negative transcriptional regulator [Kaistia hirudinis]MBB3929856.1 transcriptional regulator [Kaistia hirudinis]